MTGGFRLRLYRLLNLHRGEERKTLVFLELHLCLSASLGLLSSAIDPLYLKHATDRVEAFLLRHVSPSGGWAAAFDPNVRLIPFLLLFGAVLLMAAGLVYAGFTDRSDKARLFFRTVIVVILVCIASFVLWLLDRFDRPVPLMFSLLYTWRFVAGVFLLMIFWDLAGVYFDARQVKRLFPLLFGAGALGYAAGSLLVSPFAAAGALGAVFFLAAGLCVLSLYLLTRVRRGFSVVSAPRYRKKSVGAELREGFTVLRRNVFLKSLLFSTLMFGIAAGFIMVTYHALIDTRIDTASRAAGFMALQRAAATILEAVIVTQVLSQTRLGGASRKGILIKAALLAFGLVAYLVSMVGVADFTRQIAMALLSPAVIASYAVLPARFRGRAMALNTLVAAPAGMGAAAVVVLAFSHRLDLRVFLGLVVAALVIRLLSNLSVSRSYLRHLRRGFEGGQALPAALGVEIGDVFRDETLLRQFTERLLAADPPTCAYAWKQLAGRVRTREDYEMLAKYRPAQDSPALPEWLVLAGRYDYPSVKDEVDRALQSEDRGIRVAALAARMAAGEPCPADCSPEHLEAMLVVRAEGYNEKLENLRQNLSPERQGELLNIIARHPGTVPELMSLLEDAAKDEALLPEVLLCLERAGPVEPLFLLQYDRRPEVIEYLARLNSPKIGDFLRSRFMELAAEFTASDRSSWRGSLTREKNWAGNLNNLLLQLALGLLRSPGRIDSGVREAGEACTAEAIKTAACLYRAWRNGGSAGDDPYWPLVNRMADGHIRRLVRLVPACAGLGVPSVEQRELLYEIVGAPGFSSPYLRTKVLEAVESCLSKDVFLFVAAFLEDLTDEERDVRVFPLIRGFFPTFRDLAELWGNGVNTPEDMLASHFYNLYQAV